MKTKSRSHLQQLVTASNLITFIESLGPTYNPSNPNLTLQSLKDTVALNKELGEKLIVAKTTLAHITLAKNQHLIEVKQRVTRITYCLQALQISKTKLASIRILTKNFYPYQKKKTKTAAITPADTQNTSEVPLTKTRHSHKLAIKYAERKLNWFQELIGTLAQIPNYSSNEAELSIAGLTALANSLKQDLEVWHKEYEKLHQLRSIKNQQLSNQTEGMVTYFRSAKSYIKSVYGPQSVEAKILPNFVFKRL